MTIDLPHIPLLPMLAVWVLILIAETVVFGRQFMDEGMTPIERVGTAIFSMLCLAGATLLVGFIADLLITPLMSEDSWLMYWVIFVSLAVIAIQGTRARREQYL